MSNTLIIENEYVVDQEVYDFIEDFKEEFGEPEEVIGLLHSSFKTLSLQLEPNMNIVFRSTFMYKDQLEEFLEKFLEIPFKLSFYIYNFEYSIEEWGESKSFFWDDKDKFINNLRECAVKHDVYTFRQNTDLPVIEGKDRHPYHYKKLVIENNEFKFK